MLGPGQPATTRLHAALAAVRTLSVDVNQRNEVVGSRLLEFVSPDSLEVGSFADYVRQWEDRDFGDLRMLTHEYDLGYASKVSEVYTPGEGFRPADLALKEVSGMGKTAVTIYCYLSDIDVDWLCKYDPDTDTYYDCEAWELEIEVTCIIEGDGDEDGDDCTATHSCGDGEGDGGEGDDDDQGGDGYSGGEDEDEEGCSCSAAVPCAMEAEHDSLGVDFTIACDRFTTGGGSTHFTWSELNDHWTGATKRCTNRMDISTPSCL